MAEVRAQTALVLKRMEALLMEAGTTLAAKVSDTEHAFRYDEKMRMRPGSGGRAQKRVRRRLQLLMVRRHKWRVHR